ncbi:hypothetical protein [Nonomuraea aridisoli]|uniref:Uncharacterized protein n=1 Tax=Nonomuraea aridisoli TaxID=2070368 RepID=A0A2W2FVR3_9ACTN|nr:hypothetical protein [Nonomuraea aridisoli]PZG18934.1 hypothetical protein C1J01_13485 [Nonomuraea aridisoli]
MTHQLRLGRARRIALAVVAAGCAAPFLAATGSAQTATPAAAQTRAAAAAPTDVLTCSVRTAPNNPVTFTPPLRDATPQLTKGKGAILLENCSSPNGKAPNIASGRMELSGQATASCRGLADLRATGTVTWRDAQGKVLSTSTLAAEHKGSATLADSLLKGTVTAGRFNGQSFSGTATMTSDLRDCTTPAGFTTLTGSGRLTFA